MQGTQTHLEFIPERTTDFIFAAFSEEFGLAGNLLLIFGFWCLVLRALALSAVAPTLFSRLLAAAVSTIFFAYAFVNIGMVSGVLPVVGVPLPFISYGGTAMVTLGVALGILMSVSRTHIILHLAESPRWRRFGFCQKPLAKSRHPSPPRPLPCPRYQMGQPR